LFMLDALLQLRVKQEGSAQFAVTVQVTVSRPVPREGGLGEADTIQLYGSQRFQTKKTVSPPFLKRTIWLTQKLSDSPPLRRKKP
jgi:hypothetical protein